VRGRTTPVLKPDKTRNALSSMRLGNIRIGSTNMRNANIRRTGTQRMPDSIRAGYPWIRVITLLVLVAVSAVVTGAHAWRRLWNFLWVSFAHEDRITDVYSKSWQVAEYKSCATENAELDPPMLVCDLERTLNDEGKNFNVRFHPSLLRGDVTEGTLLRWTCRKNGSRDPAITCWPQ
jgi:hypothetical protein